MHDSVNIIIANTLSIHMRTRRLNCNLIAWNECLGEDLQWKQLNQWYINNLPTISAEMSVRQAISNNCFSSFCLSLGSDVLCYGFKQKKKKKCIEIAVIQIFAPPHTSYTCWLLFIEHDVVFLLLLPQGAKWKRLNIAFHFEIV